MREAQEKKRRKALLFAQHPRASWACESGFPHWQDSDRLPPERNVQVKFALGQEAPLHYCAGTLVFLTSFCEHQQASKLGDKAQPSRPWLSLPLHN
jgi:hypothetical protein